MLKTGILNPQINSLLSRVRHTNTVVIVDRGFPFCPTVDTIDISLVDDLPRVLDVLRAVQGNFSIGGCVMAEEFRHISPPDVVDQWTDFMKGMEIVFEPHTEFKLRVSQAIGIIRTADTTPYSNVILESA
jgi:D-ribose pyranase